MSIRTVIGDEQFAAFGWPGLAWTPSVVARQWLWAAIGLGLTLLSAAWFGRFDPSREGLRRARAKPEEAKAGELAAPRKKPPRNGPFVLEGG